MLGLNIGTRNISAVKLSRSFNNKISIDNSNLIDIREDLIIPSSNESNIKDKDELKNNLRQLLKPFRSRSKNIFLSIPDQSVKVAILRLDKIPAKPDELEKVIRWKMEKLFIHPFNDTKISHQEIGENLLLVSSIKKEIISEYEEITRSIGLAPVIVDISSFHVFNLFHDTVLGMTAKDEDYIFLNLLDSTFNLIIFKKAVMDFIRIKGFRQGEMAAERLSDELRNSLAFYGKGEKISRIFLCNDNLNKEDYARVEAALSIKVEPLRMERIASFKGRPDILNGKQASFVSALGAAMGR